MEGAPGARGQWTSPTRQPIRDAIEAIASSRIPSISIGTRHPPPVTALPTLRCRPLLLSGIPVFREILDFARVTPTARFQEKPPLFTWAILRSRVGRNRRAAPVALPTVKVVAHAPSMAPALRERLALPRRREPRLELCADDLQFLLWVVK